MGWNSYRYGEAEAAFFRLRREDNGLESFTITKFTDIASNFYVLCKGCVLRKMRDKTALLTVLTAFVIFNAAQFGLSNAD